MAETLIFSPCFIRTFGIAGKLREVRHARSTELHQAVERICEMRRRAIQLTEPAGFSELE